MRRRQERGRGRGLRDLRPRPAGKLPRAGRHRADRRAVAGRRRGGTQVHPRRRRGGAELSDPDPGCRARSRLPDAEPPPLAALAQAVVAKIER